MLKPTSSAIIVLVGTTHPGNIGGAARAMKNMGMSSLRLVAPRVFPSADATARAAGADDVLAAATVYDTLEEAVADCSLVIGASARPRALSCPTVDPRTAAVRVAETMPGSSAIVFGREHSGLTNEELDLCHLRLHIPADPEFSSLNIAAAVQIVCYELRLASLAETVAATGESADHQEVGHQEMERFYRHLEKVLVDLDFLDPANPRHLMRRLRILYNRARPDRNEINILRGILTAIEKYEETLKRRGD
jgi:tRNA (cytidine32/uridine32-2'-O)-methyltransferase